MSTLTRTEARAQREHELKTRRDAEAACALDFLVYGDGDAPESVLGIPVTPVRHADRCVFGKANACSMRYDPMPYDDAEPVDRMYEGTGIGSLYGMPGPELELEGWELAPRSVFE